MCWVALVFYNPSYSTTKRVSKATTVTKHYTYDTLHMRQVGYSWIAVGTEPMRAPPPYHDAAFGGRTDATACELASKPGGGPKSRAVAAAAVGGTPPLPAWACDAPREGGKENEAERCCSRHKHAAQDSENTPTHNHSQHHNAQEGPAARRATTTTLHCQPLSRCHLVVRSHR